MPDISHKDVLFNDGEGLVYSDLNAMQRFQHATLMDAIIGRFARSIGPGGNGSSAPHLEHSYSTEDDSSTFPQCWVFGNDAAPYGNAGINRKLHNLAGTIYQRISGEAGPDGEEAGILAYYVEADEYSYIADACVSNPRYDLVSVKLELVDDDAADEESRDFKDATTGVVTSQNVVKRRKVVATFTVTKGSEAATPSLPSLPTGHVRVAAVYVRTGNHPYDPRANEIHDWRMPMGLSVHEVRAKQMLKNESFWTDEIVSMTSTTAAAYAYACCPEASGLQRVIGVGFAVEKDTTASASVAQMVRLPGLDAPTIAPVNAWGYTSVLDHKASAFSTTLKHYLESYIDYVYERPHWSNGFTAGYAVEILNDDGTAGAPDSAVSQNTLAVKLGTTDGNNVRLVYVRFYLAGSML